MEKLDKLKEINETLNEMCIDLETKIFVEDMDVEGERIIKDYKPELADEKTIT
jgi:hypothetical protein